MQQATYTAAEFVKVGACALLNGVETGVIETKNTRYTKAAPPPAKLYKPTHGGYPDAVPLHR